MGIAREWAGRAPSSPTDPQVRHTLKVTSTLEPRTTLSEALTWALDRGLSSDKVVITGGHLSYEREETTAEYVARRAAHDKAMARQQVAIRDRYMALFGDVPPSAVALEKP